MKLASDSGEEPYDTSEMKFAKEANAKVRLTNSNVVFEQDERDLKTLDGSTPKNMICCDAALINNTGRVLYVQSHCGSAFDGLSLAVFASDGTKLCQVAYVLTCSPTREAQPFAVAPGRNEKTMRFMIGDLVDSVDEFRVQLIGKLPACDVSSVLCSNIVDVRRTAR